MTSLNILPPIVNPVKAALSPGYKHHAVVPMKIYQIENEETQELHLPLVLLLGYEEDQVEANAYHDTLTAFKGKAPQKSEPSNWDQLLEANRAYWTVYFAARLPTDLSKKWFDSKQEVAQNYTWDSIGIVLSNYITLKMTQPCYQKIDFSSSTVFQDILDQLKRFGTEDKSDFFFNGLTMHDFNQLMKFLVKERETYQKNNGSSGEPLNNIKTI